VQDDPTPPRRRFSLGKILIVTAILGTAGIVGLAILAQFFVQPGLTEFHFAALGKAQTAQIELTSIRDAAGEYFMLHGGRWPEGLEDLVGIDENGHSYLPCKTIPRDPWGNEYLYKPPQRPGDKPIVMSLGRDGKPGGEGEDADIDSESERR
jgi:general secretion pathway protein G